MASTGIFELSAISGGVGHVTAAAVLAVVDPTDATQALQGSLVKITVAQLYRTESTAVTVSTPLPDIAQQWNAGGVAFTATRVNVTDTASAAASLLLDLQVGGVSKFSVRKDGTVTVGTVTAAAGSLTGTTLNATVVTSSLTSVGTLTATTITGVLTLGGGTGLTFNTADAGLFIGAANTVYVGDYASPSKGLRVNVSTGAVTSTHAITITSGGVTLTAGSLTLGAAASQLIPGATSLSLRNNANNADNLLILDNGNVTVRGTLTVTGGIVAPAGTLTGTTLAANVVTSSLTSVGTLTALTLSGLLQCATLGGASGAPINLPHVGSAPNTPNNGDLWTTAAGMFVRINGVTKSVNLT
jgi:hypothetical protein